MVRRAVSGLTMMGMQGEGSSSPIPIGSYFLCTSFHILKGQDGKGGSYLLKWRCPREWGRPASRGQGRHASGLTGSPAGCSSHPLGVSGMGLNGKDKERRKKTLENLVSFSAPLVWSCLSLPEACRCSRGAFHTPSEHLSCSCNNGEIFRIITSFSASSSPLTLCALEQARQACPPLLCPHKPTLLEPVEAAEKAHRGWDMCPFIKPHCPRWSGENLKGRLQTPTSTAASKGGHELREPRCYHQHLCGLWGSLGNPTAHAWSGRDCSVGMRAGCCQIQNFQGKTEVSLRNHPVFEY